MSTTDGPVRRSCPGWIKLLLIVSLACNVAIVGLVIGRSLQPHNETGSRGPDRVVDWIIGMVPEERRVFALAHFAEARDQILAARAERGPQVAAVVDAIRAEPFDPARVDAALDAMSDGRASSRTVVRERMIALLAQLTPAERDAFARNFAERMGSRASGG